ncbi:MAG: DUF2283 domain-containing protein [Deltaproteobacteria bacterium]|nr:DUF2283 domain-containing protein [Deltaproteobacteria bacterium]
MRYEYDSEADALYIYLPPEDRPYSYGRDLDAERRIDYATDGVPVGIELLCVSHGVKLDDLPVRETVRQILSKLKFPAYEELPLR